MAPDRLSFPSVPGDPAQPGRPAAPAAGETPFATVIAEAIEQEQKAALAALGSTDAADSSGGADAPEAASPVDNLMNLLQMRESYLTGTCGTGSTVGGMGSNSAGNRLDNPLGAVSGNEPVSGVSGSSDIGRVISWLDSHAHLHSTHRCAASVREALEAAGIPAADHPADGGDYGPFLVRHGAQPVDLGSYEPQAGDIAVFDKTADHPFGHVQIFDGQHWVSDFVQNTFSPYRDQASTPPVTVYRMS